jgi:hypothetical protein
MKKILLVLTVILALGLGACSPPPDVYDEKSVDMALADRINEINATLDDLENYDDTTIWEEYWELNTFIQAYEEYDDRDLLIEDELLQAQINELLIAIVALENRLDNMVSVTGLNNQTVWYENEDDLSMLGMELAKEDDYIDVNDFPDYIWDINGDYITINDLASLLVAKYFADTPVATNYGVQYKFAFTYNNSEMSNEEFMARLSMLVIELSNYDYYLIDSSQLYFYLTFNLQTVQLTSRMVLLVNAKYAIAPAIFFEELLDVRVTGIDYDSVIVQQYCDDFILNEDFIGYVINYK